MVSESKGNGVRVTVMVYLEDIELPLVHPRR
jgi:hypothetical protein